MNKKLLLLIVVLTFSYTVELHAWGRHGHRVMAEIAEQNLTRRAQRRVTHLLDGFPMAYWSYWADRLRSDETGRWNHTLPWHFINIPSNLTRAEFEEHVRNFPQENVYFSIGHLSDILRDRNTSEREKAYALRLLIHFVGDLHNPMHTGREEDRGGNLINITWFGQQRNLHWVWDTGVVDEGYSFTEKANILNRVLTGADRRAMQQGTPLDWLWETYQISNEIYAGVNDGDSLGFAYQFIWSDTVELLFQRGGVRLARILNDIF
jgi:hypothetical protein